MTWRTMALGALLMGSAQAQTLAPDSSFEGAWYETGTSGQGVMLEALPGGKQWFAAWFTYAGDDSGAQRWYTAVLTVNGATGVGPIHRSSGGRRNLALPPVHQNEIGTMTIDLLDCRTARVSFALSDGDDRQTGSFLAHPARELVPDAPPCGATAKLRWPHAAPALDEAGYAAFLDSVFVLSNFGEHQGGLTDRPGDTYFHDGLDIYMVNGTPIYALEAGTVRSVSSAGSNSGFTVTVESASVPREGWSYVHIVPEVAVGATVAAGQRVGAVQFQGVQHLHLSRVRKTDTTPSWSFERLLTLDPMGWFALADDEPPTIRDGLLFLRDGTDDHFDEGAPIAGKVDIAAGMQDFGPHARRDIGFGPFGNHGVLWVDYEIDGPAGVYERYRAFDFNALGIGRPTASVWSMTPTARVVYQPILLVDVDSAADRSFSYYLLTNGTGRDRIELEDAARSWDTALRSVEGERVYPDGDYTITVYASDHAGNIATFVDTVEVRND